MPPPHGHPSDLAEPSESAPPVGGGGTQPTPPKPPKPPSAPTKSHQSITFSTSPSNAFVGGFYVVGASASSGLPVSFSLAPGSSGVCTIAGATVSFVGPGTCTVRANQAGNASYLAAPQVTQSMDVDDAVAVQTISFLLAALPAPKSTTPNVNAKRARGRPSSSTREAESAGTARSPAKVHFIGEGTCTINATQRGNSKSAGASSAAVVLDRHGMPPAECPVDQFHVVAPSVAFVGGPVYGVSGRR
jgi:hypothetical protein